MKRTFSILFLAFLLCSCSQTESTDTQEPSQMIEVSMTRSDFNLAYQKISSIVHVGTRVSANMLTEEKAKEVFKPFTEEGLAIREQLMQSSDFQELSESEQESIKQLSESQLAAMVVIFSSLSETTTDKPIDPKDLIPSERITAEKVGRCALSASGITEIRDILRKSITDSGLYNVVKGTKMLINAKTLGQMAKAIAKRYLGYIGVAIFIYDFSKCLYDANHNMEITSDSRDETTHPNGRIPQSGVPSSSYIDSIKSNTPKNTTTSIDPYAL